MVCPQLGVKALTYNDLIQAQKEISAHNQQLREQTEQLEKGNWELRSQSLRLVSSLVWAGPLLAPVHHQDALRAGRDPSLPLSTVRMLLGHLAHLRLGL